MSHALLRSLFAAVVLFAALFIAACQKQEPAPAVAPAVAPVVEKVPETAPAARAADAAPPLSPAEEKKLIDMAKSRKAADGATVWQVIDGAQQRRADKFKVSTIDIEYKKDGRPGAVQVCYWIGKKRLEEDQSCQNLAWEIAPDRQSLNPFVTAQAQAVETGKAAFLQLVDQMYDKKCGGGKEIKAC